MKIALNKIRTDGGTQPRESLEPETVTGFAEDMAQGAAFPPVTLFYDGTDYWLADGFHRVAAAARLEHQEIAAEVHQGTQRDAILHSCSANATHGQRRTNADKRRAVRTLLEDQEWSAWSDREIARRCAVGYDLVATIRKELSVGSGRYDTAPRKATRGGTTYTQAPKRSSHTSSRVATVSAPVRREAQRPARPRTHLDEALDEARAWMRRWSHLSILASVFDAITAVIEVKGGAR